MANGKWQIRAKVKQRAGEKWHNQDDTVLRQYLGKVYTVHHIVIPSDP